ncbi:MaoC/PaaZ C-terminal domain-containing protein, partial [Streptomyces nigra]
MARESPRYSTELPAQSFPVTRATLVRYAGASGDFNPIHWNE